MVHSLVPRPLPFLSSVCIHNSTQEGKTGKKKKKNVSGPEGAPRLRWRWRDVIRKDLKVIEVSENKWYDEASMSRSRWRNIYKEGLKSLTGNENPAAQQDAVSQIKCDECNRLFRRESDRK